MLRGRSLQYFATSVGLLNMITSGLFTGWPSPYLPILLKDSSLQISNDDGSWIATIFILTGALGTIATGYLMNTIGRKKTLVLSAAISLMSWIFIASTMHSLSFLLSARGFAGLADGITWPLLPVYIAEISDPEIRGFLIALEGTVFQVGALLINVLGFYLSITYSAIVCAFVPVIFVFMFIWIPETPSYYLLNDNVMKAKQVLRQIKDKEDVESEIEAASNEIDKEKNKLQVLELFTVRNNGKAVFVVMGCLVAQQISGITPIIFYTQSIFEEAADHFPILVSTTIFYLALIIFSILSAFAIDRIGRRPLLIVSDAGVGLSLMMEAINLYIKQGSSENTVGFSWVTAVNILLFICSYSFGLLGVPFVLVSELFPSNIKAVAVTFSFIFFGLISSALTKFFQFAKDEYGLHVSFFVCALFCLVNLVFIVIFVPETKKKALEEIHLEMETVRSNEIIPQK